MPKVTKRKVNKKNVSNEEDAPVITTVDKTDEQTTSTKGVKRKASELIDEVNNKFDINS